MSSKQKSNSFDPPSLVEVVWRDAAAATLDAEASARIAASIIFEHTQPSVLGPAVSRPRPRLGLGSGSAAGAEGEPQLGSPERPLSYVELAKHWTWTGFSPAEIVGRREPQRAPLPMSDMLRREKSMRGPARVRRSNGNGNHWRQVNPQSRPGQGGRRPKQMPTIRSAAAELLDGLGEPELITHKGAQIMVWDAQAPGSELGVENGLITKAGRGMAFARLSGDEVRKGENLGYHVQSALDLARNSKVPVRWVMASIENSGYQWFDERKDLLRIERLLELGELDSIFVLHLHRMARERLEIEQVCRTLQTGGASLYICAINRKLDWHLDDALIASWAMTASQEGKWIKERTHGAIIRRYLLEGRGWPGSIRYGCMRDADKYLVEDPFQMKIVRWLFDRYIELSAEGGKGGLRRLQAELWETHQTRLTHERIRTILMDPIYVSGEWHVTYNGYAVAGKPIELSNPIDKQTFQRVQELLNLRGKAGSVTPLGYFLLNYVPFFHADCAGQRAPKGKQSPIYLRGELTQDGLDSVSAKTYRHRPHCPEACRGLLVPKDEIEAAVVREVKRLLRTRIFRAAAAEAKQAAEADDQARASSSDPEAAERARLEELRNLRQSLARIEQTEEATKRAWLDGVGDGSAGVDDWQDMLGEVRAERKRLEQRIAFAEKRGDGGTRRRKRINSRDRDGYMRSAEEILTEETPEDPDHRIARAALIKALLSAVVLHHVEPDSESADAGDDDGGGGYRIELHGWLVPEDETVDNAPDALVQIKDHLDRFAVAGHQGIAEDSMAPNVDVGSNGSVKQAEACLTQPETRDLTAALQKGEPVPAELRKAKVKTGVTLPKRAIKPADLANAAFKHTFDVSGPMPQPDAAAAYSRLGLVRLAALTEVADIMWGGLWLAARKGKLKTRRIGSVQFSSRKWLADYEHDRHPGPSEAGKKRRGRRIGTDGRT